MENTKRVIEGMEALQRAMSIHQCYTCSYEFIDAANEFGTTIVSEAIELLKEQDEEIENLKQTAQSMMEGIVVSVPMKNPCSSCQEFSCDLCGWKKYRN